MSDEAAALLGQQLADALNGIEAAIASMPDLNAAIIMLVSLLVVMGILAFAVIRRDTIAFIIGGIAVITLAFQALPLYMASPAAAFGLYIIIRAGLIFFKERGG